MKKTSTLGKRKLGEVISKEELSKSQPRAWVLPPSSRTTSATAQTQSYSPPSTKKKPKQKKQDEERRLRRHRANPTGSFLSKLHRARTQRMIVLSRTRIDIDPQHPQEAIDIVGSTGNIYTVTVGPLPSCTCPDSKKGNECKHKVYALHTVLKAPAHLQYQLALLGSELREIFAHAPPIPSPSDSSSSSSPRNNKIDETSSSKRKPISGDCPICYTDLVSGDEDEANNDDSNIVWCRAGCGNNIHSTCFAQWAVASTSTSTNTSTNVSDGRAVVRCVYCRTPWEAEPIDLQSVITTQKTGPVGVDGYVNVAEHFGLSRERDYSTYHQPWVRRRFGGW